MWTLTGFADEISPDLDEQLNTLADESIHHVELRSVWNKNVLDLTDEELDIVKSKVVRHGIKVSSIGSPIGKVPVTDDFGPHLRRFRRALEVAGRMEAPYIRVFSFFIPEGQDPVLYRDEVLERMSTLARGAEDLGVTLLHENEKGIYGDVPHRCLDILTGVGSPALRAVWDAANFVQCGVKRPYSEGFETLRPFIEYVHVKDALASSGQVVPAGEGDGELSETVSALRSSGFDGFFSLEPHLALSGTYSGFSGPELFRKAAGAFKRLLREQGIEWT
ncbi:MAG: sugar phosphate isomerase/epimerase [Rubrobacteraceae bacterium]|nr:sugar phosphate isomerase/epimerase [Rubrobacteraceae bacterium]MCL6438830.1 sugar phosphate isomerase/epimerase [Rubrobacteraceae bacterium]